MVVALFLAKHFCKKKDGNVNLDQLSTPLVCLFVCLFFIWDEAFRDRRILDNVRNNYKSTKCHGYRTSLGTLFPLGDLTIEVTSNYLIGNLTLKHFSFHFAGTLGQHLTPSRHVLTGTLQVLTCPCPPPPPSVKQTTTPWSSACGRLLAVSS